MPERSTNAVRIPTIAQWVAHLDGMVRGPLEGFPMGGTGGEKAAYIGSFRDEYGSRRATDGALLSRVLGAGYACGSDPSEDLDVRLWDAVHSGTDAWRGWITDDDGLVVGDYAIEHRTLIELSSLHALWHLVERADDAGMRARVGELVDWHTRELQPDNGINRPWGVHAFVVRSVEATSEETRRDAMLHAQTLVSNCCVSMGRPDVLSAVILRDSADALRSRVSRGEGLD